MAEHPIARAASNALSLVEGLVAEVFVSIGPVKPTLYARSISDSFLS